jgi:hypothetical protein
MNYLISEQQMKIIIEQVSDDNFVKNLKMMESFSNKMVNTVKDRYDLNLNTPLNMGFSIGGFIMPINSFINNLKVETNQSQAFLLLAGVTVVNFTKDKIMIKKITDKIKSEKLEDIFEKVLSKSNELKNTFIGFIKSLGVKTDNILSYSFLIPIITDIKDNSNKEPNSITNLILSSGITQVDKSILNKIIHNLSI